MTEKEFSKVCSNLSSLSLGQLLELRVMIEAIIDLMDRSDPEPAKVSSGPLFARVYSNNVGIPGKRGHIEEKMIPRKGKRYGPYLYLRYWFDSRLRSRYIGKPSV